MAMCTTSLKCHILYKPPKPCAMLNFIIYVFVFQPYTVVNEHGGRKYNHQQKNGSYLNGLNSSPRAPSALSRGSGYDTNGSDIYVTSGAYKAPSEIR